MALERYILVSENGKRPAPAPREYIDMLVLPRQGIRYKATSKLNTIERAMLELMLQIESDMARLEG